MKDAAPRPHFFQQGGILPRGHTSSSSKVVLTNNLLPTPVAHSADPHALCKRGVSAWASVAQQTLSAFLDPTPGTACLSGGPFSVAQGRRAGTGKEPPARSAPKERDRGRRARLPKQRRCHGYL